MKTTFCHNKTWYKTNWTNLFDNQALDVFLNRILCWGLILFDQLHSSLIYFAHLKKMNYMINLLPETKAAPDLSQNRHLCPSVWFTATSAPFQALTTNDSGASRFTSTSVRSRSRKWAVLKCSWFDVHVHQTAFIIVFALKSRLRASAVLEQWYCLAAGSSGTPQVLWKHLKYQFQIKYKHRNGSTPPTRHLFIA